MENGEWVPHYVREEKEVEIEIEVKVEVKIKGADLFFNNDPVVTQIDIPDGGLLKTFGQADNGFRHIIRQFADRNIFILVVICFKIKKAFHEWVGEYTILPFFIFQGSNNPLSGVQVYQ